MFDCVAGPENDHRICAASSLPWLPGRLLLVRQGTSPVLDPDPPWARLPTQADARWSSTSSRCAHPLGCGLRGLGISIGVSSCGRVPRARFWKAIYASKQEFSVGRGRELAAREIDTAIERRLGQIRTELLTRTLSPRPNPRASFSRRREARRLDPRGGCVQPSAIAPVLASGSGSSLQNGYVRIRRSA